jgi:arylsulfatase A-like enzyme
MNRRKFLRVMTTAGASLAGGLLTTGCKWKSNSKHPRLVLLYATCSLNKYSISAYNAKVNYTPNIERFASQAAVLKNHQVECGQSGIAYASLFSGGQADHHGIFEHPRRIDDKIFLISEAYAQNGYDVFYWGEHPMAEYKLNYAQGTSPDKAFSRRLEADDKLYEKILRRLSLDKNYKAFIITNFTVTHSIYPPINSEHLENKPSDREFRNFWDLNCLPKELEATGLTSKELEVFGRLLNKQDACRFMYDFNRTINSLKLSSIEKDKFLKTVDYTYKVNVARLDRLFGRVIDKIEQQKLLDESLIVFTADHGETFHRENTFFKYTHGHQLAPEVLTVPLIIRGPALGVKPGPHEFVTRSIDVFPTMSGLSSIDIPKKHKFQGTDLSHVLKGQKEPPILPAYSHTALIHWHFFPAFHQWGPIGILYPGRDPELMWVSVRLENRVFKLAKFNLDDPIFKPAMFDLSKDPSERSNLFDPSNEYHQNVMNELKKYKMRLVDAFKYWDKTPEGISIEERLEKLKSLGYVY